MDAFTLIATNKVFIGVAILIMNMGSRFVIMDIGKMHEKLLSNEIFKKVVIFCMFFVATRDIMTSVILTFAFIVLLDGLLNEKSRFNLIPKSMSGGNHSKGPSTSNTGTSITGVPTFEQYQDALRVVQNFEKTKANHK